MSQSLLENDLDGVDKILSPGSSLQEDSEHNSQYTIPLLLVTGLTLKDKEKSSDSFSEIDLDGKFKEEITSLMLESRPAVIESLDSAKSFGGGRFGVLGFNSRGGRNNQRGRTFTGHIGGTGRRSIIRQPSENLWDMPCSEMNSLTLGDIREAESKMKAEDLTLDQYVERQRVSGERQSVPLSQTVQKKNFVSIPISGESLPIKVNNTFSLGGSSLKTSRDRIISNANVATHQNSSQFSQQQRLYQRHSGQDCPPSVGRFSRGDGTLLHSQRSTGTHHPGEPADSLRNELVGDETVVSSLFPTGGNSHRKSSSISEAFLNGPANLSLFDVNTPIFEDDNNELAVVVNTKAGNFEDGPKGTRYISELQSRGQTIFDQIPTQNSTSSFSWSNRGGNYEELDNKNMTNLSNNSQSFPALSKSSQCGNPQVKLHCDNSSAPSQPNILQRLQAAAIAPKLTNKTLVGNNLGHNDSYFESKPKHRPSVSEYPPLSSASNMLPLSSASSSLPSPGYNNNLKLNSQLKSNEAGRLLMSIIGAGQQNNRNYSSNFNMGGTHTSNNNGSSNNNNNNNNSGQVGNFARY